MSATGVWRPAPIVKTPPGGTFDLPLRNIMRERFDLPVGDSYEEPGRVGGRLIESTESNRAWLQGLVDAGVEEADELLEALRKHGRIEVWLVY